MIHIELLGFHYFILMVILHHLDTPSVPALTCSIAIFSQQRRLATGEDSKHFTAPVARRSSLREEAAGSNGSAGAGDGRRGAAGPAGVRQALEASNIGGELISG